MTLAILGALALGLGAMANTASAQSVLDVVKNVATKAKDKVKGKVVPGKKGPAALPGLAKKGKQLLDPKAKQLIGSKGARQRPSDEGQDRQGQARHKGQAHHQGQDRKRPAHQRQGGKRQARKGQDRKRQAGERQDRQGQAGEGQSRQRQDRKGQDRERPGRERQGSEGPDRQRQGRPHQIQNRQGSGDQDWPRPVCKGEVAGRAHAESESRTAPRSSPYGRGCRCACYPERSGSLACRPSPRHASCRPRWCSTSGRMSPAPQWRLRRRGTA